jgi:hypothetical protein
MYDQGERKGLEAHGHQHQSKDREVVKRRNTIGKGQAI